MAPIKTAMPALWGFVDGAIKESCEKGYIRP